jgi:hypothetical protein
MPGTMTPKKGMKVYTGKKTPVYNPKTGAVEMKSMGGKIKYKYMGGKIDDKNYASCGANIMRTK